MDNASINVGLLGWGTVGTGVSKILLNQSNLIEQNAGIQLRLIKIAKRTLPASRPGVELGADCLTTDPAEIVGNPEIDIVVELMGGTDEARLLVTQAIRNGKHVVTANKALLAAHGFELFQLADKHNVSLNFEASAAGGHPNNQNPTGKLRRKPHPFNLRYHQRHLQLHLDGDARKRS